MFHSVIVVFLSLTLNLEAKESKVFKLDKIAPAKALTSIFTASRIFSGKGIDSEGQECVFEGSYNLSSSILTMRIINPKTKKINMSAYFRKWNSGPYSFNSQENKWDAPNGPSIQFENSDDQSNILTIGKKDKGDKFQYFSCVFEVKAMDIPEDGVDDPDSDENTKAIFDIISETERFIGEGYNNSDEKCEVPRLI